MGRHADHNAEELLFNGLIVAAIGLLAWLTWKIILAPIKNPKATLIVLLIGVQSYADCGTRMICDGQSCRQQYICDNHNPYSDQAEPQCDWEVNPLDGTRTWVCKNQRSE